MNESVTIIDTLKDLLKSHGLTYKSLGAELGISEASVKRIFSNQTFSLNRVEEICKVLGISMLELCELASKAKISDQFQYSLEQETFLAKNPKYLAYFDMLVNGKKPKQIAHKYGLTEKLNFKYLKKLDELSLIELHGENKVKLLHSKSIKWREEGPLKKLFINNAKFEFLNSEFSKESEQFKFSILPLSEESSSKFKMELNDLYKKYERSSQLEQKIKLKTRSVGVLIALRKWNFSVLEKLSL